MTSSLAKLVLAWLVLLTSCLAVNPPQIHLLRTVENDYLQTFIDAANQNVFGVIQDNPRILTFGKIWEQQLTAAEVQERLINRDIDLVQLGTHRGNPIFGVPLVVHWQGDQRGHNYILLLRKVGRDPLEPLGFAYTPGSVDNWLNDPFVRNRLVKVRQIV